MENLQCTFFGLNIAILIILSVFRMVFPCLYLPQLVLVFYHFYVGSPLKVFVCLLFYFNLSSHPSLCFNCNSCGDILARILH